MSTTHFSHFIILNSLRYRNFFQRTIREFLPAKPAIFGQTNILSPPEIRGERRGWPKPQGATRLPILRWLIIPVPLPNRFLECVRLVFKSSSTLLMFGSILRASCLRAALLRATVLPRAQLAHEIHWSGLSNTKNLSALTVIGRS